MLKLILILMVFCGMTVQAGLEVGQKAPAFSAPATGSTTVSLSDYAGNWLVLYFYPKADTPGCTKQSCSLRDGAEDLSGLNAEVLGVSVDTVDAQDRFKAKYELPFELLADAGKDVAKAYGVLGYGGRMAKRVTFIIDPTGTIVQIIKRVSVGTHADQVQQVLGELQAKSGD